MAYAGRSVEEIASAVELPRSELEFIVKINRDRLMFDERQLPEWVHRSSSQEQTKDLGELGERFRQACDEFKQKAQP